MGKGDIKTRRGKIFRGTYGISRQRRKMKKMMPYVEPTAAIVPEIPIATTPAGIIKPKPKKAAPKKSVPKRAAQKKATPKIVKKEKTAAAKKPSAKRKKI